MAKMYLPLKFYSYNVEMLIYLSFEKLAVC